MNLTTGNDLTTTVDGDTNSQLNGKLAAYFAVGGAMATALSSQAQAAVVFNNTVQPFGINGNVNIDFNNDSQVDFQLDHDQVDLGGGNIVDYLQIDKNDVNGASLGENPLPINEFGTFPLNSTTMPNNTITAAYAIPGTQGDYPSALSQGTLIGPATAWDFQETANFASLGETIRANRLIDEDAGQVDMTLGGLTPRKSRYRPMVPTFWAWLAKFATSVYEWISPVAVKPITAGLAFALITMPMLRERSSDTDTRRFLEWLLLLELFPSLRLSSLQLLARRP